MHRRVYRHPTHTMIRGPWGRRRQIFTAALLQTKPAISLAAEVRHGHRWRYWTTEQRRIYRHPLHPDKRPLRPPAPYLLTHCVHTPLPPPPLSAQRVGKLIFGALFLLKKRLSVLAKSDPDPYLWPMDPDPDPGGPKHMDPDPQNWRDVSIIWKCYMSTITQLRKWLNYPGYAN